MDDLLLAPNAVPWLREYLSRVFPGLLVVGKIPVEVFTSTGRIQVPNETPGGTPAGGFIVAERTGGGTPTPVTELATLMVDSWHNDEAAAERQLLLVKAALEQSLNQPVAGSYAVRFEAAGGPLRMPDPDYPAARYRMNIALHLRRNPTPIDPPQISPNPGREE